MAYSTSPKLLWVLVFNIPFFLISQTGPGGVGSTDGTSDLNLWLRSGYGLTIPSGNNVSSWLDQSGNSRHLLQTTSTYQPQQSTNALNGYTSIILDGTDDFLTTGSFSTPDTQSAHSTFIVWKYIGGYPNQYESIFASTNASSPETIQISSSGSNASGSFSSGNKLIGLHSLFSTFNITTVNRSSSNIMDSWINETSSSSTSITSTNTQEFKLYKFGVNRNGLKFLNTELVESIIFYTDVSEVKRIIINNYLSAKFNIGLTSHDYFIQDNSGAGNFDHHVAGIGQASDGSSHTNSKGTGIIQINNPSDLQNDEYLFWGEDSKNSSYTFNTSSDYTERQSSTWRVSKRNNLGTVSVSVSASDLDLSGKQSCAPLYLIVSSTSSFSSKTSYSMTLSSGVYTANNISFTDADYFTLEFTDKIVVDNVQFYNGSGSSNVPNTTDGCYKLLVKSTSNGSLPITENAEVREIEVETGGVLTISSRVYLSIAGNIVNNGTINIEEETSLIQTGAGTDNNSGSGTYQVKRSGNNSSYVYNIWSSPIQSATLTSVFSGANPCDIWVFDKDNQTWSHDFSVGYSTTCNGNSVTFSASDVISGGDGLMDVTGGYFVPGNPTALKTYNGTINNGLLYKAISTTTLGNPGGTDWADDDWNLLGNPYPSGLSANDFWNENAINNSRITDALYFWDEADTTGGYNQNSDYASWNLSGGVNSGNSGIIPGGNIASGQGFWVVANTNTNIVFNNSMRTYNNSQFFKTSQQINQHNAWISFTSPSGYQNNILVGYNQNTTDSVDLGYDAHKLVGNAHVRFATYIQTDEYVIQSVAPLNIGDSKIIPLVVFTDEYGNHQFNEYKRANLPSNFKIYLRDKFLGTDHNLADGPYNIELSPNVEYKSRFELVFKYKMQQTTGGGNGSKGSGNVTSVNEYIDPDFSLIQNQEYISISHPNSINGNITIIDITGKILFQKQNLNGPNNLNIYWNNFASGSYFITIQNNDQRTFFRQLFK